MQIIALISTFEDELLESAINSTADLDLTIVFDGPTNADVNFEDHRNAANKRTSRDTFYNYKQGYWKSDADKRTAMLREAQAFNEDAWAIWIDSDELLLFGSYLKDHCRRAEQETSTGGTTIRIVEYDGSVAQCYGKIIRIGPIDRYVMSSYEILLKNGMTVALPNVPICSAGGIPIINEFTGADDPRLATNRPPVIGEPHLLHRHGLRNPERKVERLHDTEAADFQTLVEGDNLGNISK